MWTQHSHINNLEIKKIIGTIIYFTFICLYICVQTTWWVCGRVRGQFARSGYLLLLCGPLSSDSGDMGVPSICCEYHY